MTKPDEFPLWRGRERVDGMRVCRAIDCFDADDIPDGYEDTWVAIPPDKRKPITSCPCCVGVIGSARTAKLLADKVYPVIGGTA